ncbi:MAG: prepilin-type N-terminal cleavage/methylation domain-containing protein [Deltaproteobacteria bacterium]|nr:prepilin-type N-terminal cleavage/methylation domain-containing protein [Deltaproteobacteria bacterium]
MNIKDERGFSLIELLVVVALIAIIAAIAMMGRDTYQGRQLKAASQQLYGDLQKVRVDAMTKSNAANSRGFGIRFTSSSAYRVFEFNDSNTADNYQYDGTAEEANPTDVILTSGITVTLGNTTTPPTGTGNVLIFSKQGLPKDNIWGQDNRIYVIQFSGVSQIRCVNIANVTIREGVWDAANSSCAIQ